jgi:hypothetical protein
MSSRTIQDVHRSGSEPLPTKLLARTLGCGRVRHSNRSLVSPLLSDVNVPQSYLPVVPHDLAAPVVNSGIVEVERADVLSRVLGMITITNLVMGIKVELRG